MLLLLLWAAGFVSLELVRTHRGPAMTAAGFARVVLLEDVIGEVPVAVAAHLHGLAVVRWVRLICHLQTSKTRGNAKTLLMALAFIL